MAIVLGIDTAWTARQPSGVALIDTTRPGAKCVIAAPGYGAFLERAAGRDIDWDAAQEVGEAPVAELLAASERQVGSAVDVVAVDMPVSTQAITGRREADNAVSREFGGRKCSTHSPGVERPGPLGARLTVAFASCGYAVATMRTPVGTPRRLLEVYPHPALLALLGREQRVPYKVSRSRKYWPGKPPEERAVLLRMELKAIEAALTDALGPLPFQIPGPEQRLATRVLKAYEDALDAVVSAWVGVLYLEGNAVGLGDETAAVWCPRAVVRA